MTPTRGQSCWSTSSPGVNLNSRPVGQTASTPLGCQAATMASSTYAFFSKGITMDLHLSANFHKACGNIIISVFHLSLNQASGPRNYRKLKEGMTQSKTVFPLFPETNITPSPSKKH